MRVPAALLALAALLGALPAAAIDVFFRSPAVGKPALGEVEISVEVVSGTPVEGVVFRVDGEIVARLAEPWTPERQAEVTRIPAGTLREMVAAYREADGAALYCSTGVNMGAHGGTPQASKSYFGEPVCETIFAGDINGDGHLDVYNSRNTITKLLRALPCKFAMKITTIGKDEI